MGSNQHPDDELIKLYGEVIMRFENICSHIRFTIITLMFGRYTEAQFRAMEILLEGLSAEQVRKKCMTLIIEKLACDAELMKVAKRTYKHFETMIPLRNSFVHGTSLLTKFSMFRQFDEGHLILKHSKLKSNGLDFNLRTYSQDTLDKLVSKMQYMEGAMEVVLFAVKAAMEEVNDKKETFIHMATSVLESYEKVDVLAPE